MKENENDGCLIATVPCCGAVVFVCMNDRVADHLKDVGELIRDGCSTTHTTVAEFRKMKCGCKCDKTKK